MSYFQATIHKPHSALIAYKPVAGLGKARKLLHQHSLCPHSTLSFKLQEQVYPRLILVSVCHKKLGPLYALSGKENPEIINDYIHIIRGEELYRLARDYTRYLVTGKRTARLKRAMLNWRDFSESITKKNSTQEDLYGRPTDSEFTWWQQPQKFIHRLEELCRGYLRRPHAQES